MKGRMRRCNYWKKIIGLVTPQIPEGSCSSSQNAPFLFRFKLVIPNVCCVTKVIGPQS